MYEKHVEFILRLWENVASVTYLEGRLKSLNRGLTVHTHMYYDITCKHLMHVLCNPAQFTPSSLAHNIPVSAYQPGGSDSTSFQ